MLRQVSYPAKNITGIVRVENLPIASSGSAGIVRVGQGFSVDPSGLLIPGDSQITINLDPGVTGQEIESLRTPLSEGNTIEAHVSIRRGSALIRGTWLVVANETEADFSFSGASVGELGVVFHVSVENEAIVFRYDSDDTEAGGTARLRVFRDLI